MSYILDALRKAESERERGRVPGVHAQPGFGGGVLPGSATAARRGVPWIAMLIAALVVLAALLGWVLMRRDAAPVASGQAIAQATQATQFPPSVSVVPALPAAPVSIAEAPRQVPRAAAQPTYMPPPAIVPTQTAPTAVAPPPLDATPSRKVRAGTPPPDAPSTATVPAPAPTKPAHVDGVPDARVYATNELPDEIRRQLPTLAIGGSMYSPVAANRILIINGQVLHEGERITPELQLVQIKLKAAVLAFKGYRYEMAF